MVRRQHSEGTKIVHERLNQIFSADWLRDQAKETGLIQRMRKVDPVLLFWILVLQSGPRLQNSIESLRREYNANTAQDIVYSSFYERFRPELVDFLERCVTHAIEHLTRLGNRKLSDRLDGFKDILIQDSTVIRLHEKLAKFWPATRSRTVAAGVKIATLVSVVADGPRRVQLFGERTAEAKTLKIGPWVKDRLLLFDLGFYEYRSFARILENGGSFISRLKTNANPLIIRQLNTVRGNSVMVEGERLQDVLGRLKREVLDVIVEVSFRRRSYGGSRSGDVLRLRMIAIRNDETGKYHTYVTNLDTEMFTPADIASLYKVRWEVELLFKEMKSEFRIDLIPTGNPDAVKAMLWTGLLATILHRVAFITMCELNPDRAHGYSHARSAKTFRERGAELLLYGMLEHQGIDFDLMDFMTVEDSGAFHPHRETDTHLREWRA